MRKQIRRINTDVYDTDTKDGYQLVQEDWIAGSIKMIREYCQSIDKECNKQYKDTGYIMEKTRKILKDVTVIEERILNILNTDEILNKNLCLNAYQRDSIKDILYEHNEDMRIKIEKIMQDNYQNLKATIDDKLQDLTRYG